MGRFCYQTSIAQGLPVFEETDQTQGNSKASHRCAQFLLCAAAGLRPINYVERAMSKTVADVILLTFDGARRPSQAQIEYRRRNLGRPLRQFQIRRSPMHVRYDPCCYHDRRPTWPARIPVPETRLRFFAKPSRCWTFLEVQYRWP